MVFSGLGPTLESLPLRYQRTLYRVICVQDDLSADEHHNSVQISAAQTYCFPIADDYANYGSILIGPFCEGSGMSTPKLRKWLSGQNVGK